MRKRLPWLAILAGIRIAAGALGQTNVVNESTTPCFPLKVRVLWGHNSKVARGFYIKLLSTNIWLPSVEGLELEPGDVLNSNFCRTIAGAADVDGLDIKLLVPPRQIKPIENVQQIWRYLLEHSDADTTRRLKSDPGFRPDDRKLTLQMSPEGTAGFSLTADQLLRERNFWIPELDVFISAQDPPISLAQYKENLAQNSARRVLDDVASEPEATYSQFVSRWEDMGSPDYRNPQAVPPGHIIGISWDSSMAKFGIDRGANVWPDYGSRDRFYLGLDLRGTPEGATGAGPSLSDINSPEFASCWKGQRLIDGLPVIQTRLERNGVRYDIEQFAFPLDGPPKERRGDIEMVLFEKIIASNLTAEAQPIAFGLHHHRGSLTTNGVVSLEKRELNWLWKQKSFSGAERVWLAAESKDFMLQTNTVPGGAWTTNCAQFATSLAPHASRELIIRMPSAPLSSDNARKLTELPYNTARKQTLAFWSDYLARGAQFTVPEASVNTLFRANLWHALRLPRRHGGALPDLKIDLPYSNFAYGQSGTPWPVNQAVYVDYMLYDLRGYHLIAAEELGAMFRNNQAANGHVRGFANWGVYTPGMLYSIAKHFLLSGDRTSFESMLPQTLRALDWCLAETLRSGTNSDAAAGLMLAPLNDLSHEPRGWAFNQAYLYAGLDLLGLALAQIHHPRAAECRLAAQKLRAAIQQAFGRASMLSPLVQLRDGTWVPYVPGDVLTQHRLLDIWYPTDVDCGPLHLSRLKALDPNGPLTTYMLLDHEDNLFLNRWGMANEPVYNQQATAYLLRDNPSAAIRAFYSMMACAFSHSLFEPVEHRWAWGQYFGPPSTDGAWFELYRNMLVRESDDGSLLLCEATPRKWLEDGREIKVERAPTYFGQLNFEIQSRSSKHEVRAFIKTPERAKPTAIILRVRHPTQAPIRSVTVNGQNWTQFDVEKEWIRISHPTEKQYRVLVRYAAQPQPR